MNSFEGFPKIARLSKEVVVTEKLDGTNAQVFVEEVPEEWDLDEHFNGSLLIAGDKLYLVTAGSRGRYLSTENDNFGFARWVHDHVLELVKLGPGRHFGEWYGQGIQRGYGLDHKRFALFNVARWGDPLTRPNCCGVVPVIYRGPFRSQEIDAAIERLRSQGSFAVPGYMNPEGIVAYHTGANVMFKKTFDDAHKGNQCESA